MDTTNEKKNFYRFRLFLFGACAATIIAIALRIINLFVFYDANIGYHSSDSPFPIITNVFIVLAVLAFAVCAFLFTKKAEISDGTHKGIAVKITSAICVLAFAALAVLTVYSIVSFITIPSFKSILFLIAALISAAYFAMNLLKGKTEIASVLSIAMVVVFVFFLAASYFDVYTQMNSPNKLILHMACLAAMIFFLSEARCIIGTQKKVLYVFSLTSAALLIGVSSLPSVIAYHAGILESYNYIVFDYVLLAVWAYVVTRLILCFFEKKEIEAADNVESFDERTYEDNIDDTAQEEAVEQSAPSDDDIADQTNEQTTEGDAI